MKALLYKEFRLAMHPICYLFILLFPFMVLIPNYPLAISFIYILSTYPILFLGANKGQQSNDLLYSTLMPVRKKDIVLARIITVIVIQVTSILIQAALVPLAILINGNVPEAGSVGIGLDGYVSMVAIVLIGYAIADLIYFSIYYKNGKSIVMSTLLMIIGFIVYLSIFTIAIPYIPGCEWYTDILVNKGIGIQFAFLGGALLISFILHFIVYKSASKELEKVDF